MATTTKTVLPSFSIFRKSKKRKESCLSPRLACSTIISPPGENELSACLNTAVANQTRPVLKVKNNGSVVIHSSSPNQQSFAQSPSDIEISCSQVSDTTTITSPGNHLHDCSSIFYQGYNNVHSTSYNETVHLQGADKNGENAQDYFVQRLMFNSNGTAQWKSGFIDNMRFSDMQHLVQSVPNSTEDNSFVQYSDLSPMSLDSLSWSDPLVSSTDVEPGAVRASLFKFPVDIVPDSKTFYAYAKTPPSTVENIQACSVQVGYKREMDTIQSNLLTNNSDGECSVEAWNKIEDGFHNAAPAYLCHEETHGIDYSQDAIAALPSENTIFQKRCVLGVSETQTSQDRIQNNYHEFLYGAGTSNHCFPKSTDNQIDLPSHCAPEGDISLLLSTDNSQAENSSMSNPFSTEGSQEGTDLDTDQPLSHEANIIEGGKAENCADGTGDEDVDYDNCSSEGDSKDKDRNGKNKVQSYIALISKAILNSPEKRLIISDIYAHIRKNNSSLTTSQKSWQNSVRHNLSLNECFVKQARQGKGRGHYWMVHPACVQDFLEGNFQRRQARQRAKKCPLTLRESNLVVSSGIAQQASATSARSSNGPTCMNAVSSTSLTASEVRYESGTTSPYGVTNTEEIGYKVSSEQSCVGSIPTEGEVTNIAVDQTVFPVIQKGIPACRYETNVGSVGSQFDHSIISRINIDSCMSVTQPIRLLEDSANTAFDSSAYSSGPLSTVLYPREATNIYPNALECFVDTEEAKKEKLPSGMVVTNLQPVQLQTNFGQTGDTRSQETLYISEHCPENRGVGSEYADREFWKECELPVGVDFIPQLEQDIGQCTADPVLTQFGCDPNFSNKLLLRKDMESEHTDVNIVSSPCQISVIDPNG